MPKSKRNKIVHLTQVKKKGKDHKEGLMKQVKLYVDQFDRVYIFDFDSTKSDRIMVLRVKLKQFGRIFAGRNEVVTTTLKSISKYTGTNYDKLCHQIKGHRGLLFSNINVHKLICLLDKELPEFRKKLLGYAQISPPDKRWKEDDHDDHDEDNSGKSKNKNKKEIIKKETKLSDDDDADEQHNRPSYEVEFIKI